MENDHKNKGIILKGGSINATQITVGHRAKAVADGASTIRENSQEADQAKVLISWSGERSRQVAEALRDWLPLILQPISFWMSARDLKPGKRWSGELALELGEADFGILCLTESNLNAPWILFEAGALSKSVKCSHVVPYLYEIDGMQITGPLDQFQYCMANKTGTEALVNTIVAALRPSLGLDSQSNKIFWKWWPEFQQELELIQRSE